MNNENIDIGEILCEAVDTIVSKRLQGLNFDITKTCRVIDDTYKRQGKYTVTDNSINFEAYSAITTLNIGDSVLINIPEGNYNNQKTILNKIMYEDSSSALSYISPLDSMLKFTDNILDHNTAVTSDFSILANEENTSSIKKLYTFKWDNEYLGYDYSGYDRMGVSAKFQTWLSRYNTISGIYGLKFVFYSKDGVTAYEYDFNINDMTGNPYEFEAFYKQEKLFDISTLTNIEELDIYLYQQGNFYDGENEYIPWKIEGDPIIGEQDKKLENNILVSDLQIYLGYPLEDFHGDSVKISTPGYLSYSKIEQAAGNKSKTLNLRWIHEEEDGTYSVLTNDDVIKRNIKVYWFIYSLNATTTTTLKDIAGGANWVQTGMEQSKSDQFICTFTPNTEKAEERVKAVCTLMENGTMKKFSSDILVFENEQAVIDTATYNAVTGLSIHCVDNSEGNYFIYNQSGEIINEGQGQGYERKFEARFRGRSLYDKTSTLKEITQITWTLPYDNQKMNTMLTYKEQYIKSDKNKSEEEILIEQANGQIKVVRLLEKAEEGILNTYQSYNIKNNWHSANSMNTVSCEIVADGNIYTASLDLNFGKSGTSGTNLTLILDYDNGKNGYDVSVDVNGIVKTHDPNCYIKASLYDMSGSKVKVSEEDKWEWSWYHQNNSFVEYLRIENTEDPSRVNLTNTNNFGSIKIPEDNYHILQLTYTPKNTGKGITTYLPIAIKNSQYSHIEGARKIIYNSQGIPSYYNDAYTIHSGLDQSEIYDEYLAWRLKWDNNSNIDDHYGPKLKPLIKNNNTYSALLASAFYIKGYNDRACVSAIYNNNVIWSQPILIMQSQYDYAIINDWTGSIELNDENATIMSAMLGAGHKNDDNTFSGILIGDINSTTAIAEDDGMVNTSTGIYGISSGIISFSLTESGSALFGKNNINGNVILGNENILNGAGGRFNCNIDDGTLSIIHGLGNSNPEQLLLSAKTSDSYLKFIGSNGTNIIDFANNNYTIKSVNSNLQINLNDETITLNTPAKITGSGVINCGTFYANNGNQYIGNIAENGYYINLGNFKVDSNAEVYYKNVALSTYIQNLIDNALKQG